MTPRTLMLAAAGAAALSLAACNRPAEEPATDTAAMDAESTTANGEMAGATEGSATSGSGSAAAGSGAAPSSGTGATSSTTGSVEVTGQVDSAIPADAPSRNTRETQAAAGTDSGQVMPYAYSPTNPQLDEKN